MEKENLKRIFEFLEEKEEHNPPFLWKWKNNIPLIEEDLNVKGDLNLAYSKIKSFPEGLKVAGDLDLQDSYVKSSRCLDLIVSLKFSSSVKLTKKSIEAKYLFTNLLMTGRYCLMILVLIPVSFKRIDAAS